MQLPVDYPTLLTRLDQWHRAVRDRFPGVVPCRAGCSACCHGPFDISVADALVVRNAIRALPDPVREGVQMRARDQVECMTAAEPSFGYPWDVSRLGESRFDALVDQAADTPCPALGGSGECLIYEDRPMVCRAMGIGMRTSSGAVLENACPIQGDYPAFQSLSPQPFDLEAWEAEESIALRDAAGALFADEAYEAYETTIAGAVMLTGV